MRNYLFFKHHFDNKERIILRDYLALERTKLANERTLLSYVRAALYLIIGALTLSQLPIEETSSLQILIHSTLGIGVLLFLIGIWRYIRLQKRLYQFYEQVSALSNENPE